MRVTIMVRNFTVLFYLVYLVRLAQPIGISLNMIHFGRDEENTRFPTLFSKHFNKTIRSQQRGSPAPPVRKFSPSPKLNVPGSWRLSSFRPSLESAFKFPEVVLMKPVTVKSDKNLTFHSFKPFIQSISQKTELSFGKSGDDKAFAFQPRPKFNLFSSQRRARKILNKDSSKFKYQDREFYFPKNRLKRMDTEKKKKFVYKKEVEPQLSRIKKDKTKVEQFFENVLRKSKTKPHPNHQMNLIFIGNIPNTKVLKLPLKPLKNFFSRPKEIGHMVTLPLVENGQVWDLKTSSSAKQFKILPTIRVNKTVTEVPKNRKKISLENVKLKARIESCPKISKTARLTCVLSGFEGHQLTVRRIFIFL